MTFHEEYSALFFAVTVLLLKRKEKKTIARSL